MADADVVIIGAGPAGLSAAVALRCPGVARVVVLDRAPEAGGVPRFCGHWPYGLREFNRPMHGPAYARRLTAEARAAGAEIRTATTATALHEGPAISVTSNAGPGWIDARLVLLATGTRETTRAGRLIGGTKPGGVMTTGALQGLVHGAGLRPFRRPVILGTELVAFSAILTCRHAGIRPVAMVGESPRVTARLPAALLPPMLGIPLLMSTRTVLVEGRDRVEGVVIEGPGGQRRLDADGLIVTGRFRPEATLVRESPLALDQGTCGPEIDEDGRTSDPSVFAAGNVPRPVETAGWCWEEGRRVRRAMAQALAGRLPAPTTARTALTNPLCCVVPQRRAGGAEPAFDRLQLRADGHEIAGRSGAFRPERRVLLPLPPHGSPAGVVLEDGAVTILAIDQGTTSTRAMEVREDGDLRVLRAIAHRQIYPRPGWVEHDPEELLANIDACLSASDEADTIGIANQGESCLGWDAVTGAPASPVIVWQDERTADETERLRAESAEALTLARAGLPLDP